MVKQISLALLLISLSTFSYAGFWTPDFKVSVGLGSGTGKLEYGDKKWEPETLAGHIDLYAKWHFLLLGASYLSIAPPNIDQNRTYAAMTTLNLGIGIGSRIELFYGLGLGKWRRNRVDEPTTPSDTDYIAYGGGDMVSARIYLLSFKGLSIGLSGTYFNMTSDDYTSILDGVKTENTDKASGGGTMGALVFRWTPTFKSK